MLSSTVELTSRDEKRLADIARSIQARLRRTVEDLIFVGERLMEARKLLSDGEWGLWVSTQTGMSLRHAQRWMKVTERVHFKSDILSRLPASGLLMLAAPSTPEIALAEAERRARDLNDDQWLTVGEIEAIIDKYRMLEGIHFGAKALLKEYGETEDGQPARTVPRSAITSLETVTGDALQRGAVEIEGIDHPIPDPQPQMMTAPIPDLPNTIRMAIHSETRRRQEEHVADGMRYKVVVRRREVEAFIAVGYRGTTNVVLNVLDVGDAFEQGETVYVTVERRVSGGFN